MPEIKVSHIVPSITVYEPTNENKDAFVVLLNNGDSCWAKRKVIPDPSYIRAIVFDPSIDGDKIKRLQHYFNQFAPV